MNANELAVLIAQKESGKKEVDIAQISEILASIKEVYKEYVGGATTFDVPFRINKFLRVLTADLNLGLYITQEGDDFSITLKGNSSKYTKFPLITEVNTIIEKEKQNDTNI